MIGAGDATERRFQQTAATTTINNNKKAPPTLPPTTGTSQLPSAGEVETLPTENCMVDICIDDINGVAVGTLSVLGPLPLLGKLPVLGEPALLVALVLIGTTLVDTVPQFCRLSKPAVERTNKSPLSNLISDEIEIFAFLHKPTRRDVSAWSNARVNVVESTLLLTLLEQLALLNALFHPLDPKGKRVQNQLEPAAFRLAIVRLDGTNAGSHGHRPDDALPLMASAHNMTSAEERPHTHYTVAQRSRMKRIECAKARNTPVGAANLVNRNRGLYAGAIAASTTNF
jgi:hypothetical protein